MRILKITLAAILAIAAAALGQELKIGYVQVEPLMENFPEHEDASKTYEKEIASWESQLKQYQEEVAAMEEEYQQRAMLYSPEKKREKQETILAKRQEAVKFYQDIFGPQGKAEQRKIELLTPIYEKVNRAIEILGERDGYTMIFNAQGLLYAKEELDLTEEVLKVLKAGVDTSPSGGTRRSPGR
ncbi:MAG: OmpH family outer membrane protein [Candidatus Glassbacteria bacterium]|nr:OmpH family outer membrane protein [Candidatus Glassbacteria bacterium]